MGSLFPNWTGWKTVKIILTGVAIAATSLATGTGLPAVVHGIAASVAQIDGAVLAVVIFLSGTAVGPAMMKKPTAPKTNAS